MREFWKHIVLAVALLTLGCSSLQVSQDYDIETDFSGLNTFVWKSANQEKTGDIRVDNPLLDARIRAAVQRALTAKGFRKSPTGAADFTVSYVFQIHTKIRSDNVRTGVGFGFGGSGSFGSVGVSSGGNVREFDEGMLVIDLTDPGGSRLLWRGTAIRPISPRSDPAQITADVDETVNKILAQFPPQPQ